MTRLPFTLTGWLPWLAKPTPLGDSVASDPDDNEQGNDNASATLAERGTMPKLQYTLVGDSDDSNIVVFCAGNPPMVAHCSHPNFDAIVKGAREGDANVIDLFDVAATAAQHFDRLSDRVTVANGQLYCDGEPVNDALAAQVLRFLDAGVEDWRPLVALFENVQANPNPHSRTQLYSWLQGRDFTITADGMLVGYKGVKRDGDGNLVSVNAGRAIVNGETVQGNIPNPLGAIVEMPRTQVQHDPATGCSTGLHVGTYDYAQGWAQGALLKVLVNPRDVVSVPTDCSAAKLRCCRYRVVAIIDAPETAPVVAAYGDDYDGSDDYYGDAEY